MDALMEHFSLLIQNKSLEVWNRSMSPGGDREQMVAQKIAEADLVLPIVSAHFFNSEEMMVSRVPLIEKILQDTSRTTKIYPIIARSCLIEESIFKNLPLLPANARPIQNWNPVEDAYAHIVQEIKQRLSL